MKQVYVSLTILHSYLPEDLGLDENASNKEVYKAAKEDVSKIIDTIQEMTNLSVNDIEVEVCEVN